MTVTSGYQRPGQPEAHRWQVLTVTNGRVSDIRGYEQEADARVAAGLT